MTFTVTPALLNGAIVMVVPLAGEKAAGGSVEVQPGTVAGVMVQLNAVGVAELLVRYHVTLALLFSQK